MRFDVGTTNGSGSVYLTQPASGETFSFIPPLNTWTHLAVVATTGGTQLYVNGLLQQTLGPFSLGTDATAQVTIGNTGDQYDPFAGRLDELRLYNRALSPSEIQVDMNTPL